MKKNEHGSFRVKLVFSQTLYSQSAASVTMGSLAAYLRSAGLPTDLCLLGKRSLHNADIILGDSVSENVVIAKPNFKDFRTMFPLLERLKKFGSVRRIFFCGPFAKLNASDLMAALGWLDGIFIDQPETSAGLLLETMTSDFSTWDFASPGSISRNPLTAVIGEHKLLTQPLPLSALPFPVRDIEEVEDVGYVNMEASRGCFFDCSFCHVPLAAEISKLNVRDPVLVVDEIQALHRKLGKTLFIFNDSCFWSTKKDDARILRFCEEIAKRKLDVRFYVYLKGEPFIGDDVLEVLVKAGLVRIFLGVENSVKTSLALYRKKIKSDLYSTVKAKLDPLGVNIHIGYITIEPTSSLDDVLSNIEYLYSIGKLFRLGVIMEPVRVVPGSHLHVDLITAGLLDKNLRYDELTYGYRFMHEEVGCLLHEWKNLFEGELKEVAYGFEYYSTTGELLRVLACRQDPKFAELLPEHYASFNTVKQQGMDLLLEYFKASIKSARAGVTGSISDPKSNQKFIAEFRRITADFAVLYAAIISVVKWYGGERIVREVYIG